QQQTTCQPVQTTFFKTNTEENNPNPASKPPAVPTNHSTRPADTAKETRIIDNKKKRTRGDSCLSASRRSAPSAHAP
ncbi:hypothetical protein, partial [Thauera linaloolentis]